MPLFYTPKPRQFHYEPRLYDPEKEEWERIKKRYNYTDDGKGPKNVIDTSSDEVASTDSNSIEKDTDLAYFEDKVREMDRKERRAASKFTLSDVFRKREMPKFNYQPRFNGTATTESDAPKMSPEGQAIMERMRKRKMGRRFDIEDADYYKPIPAGKIMMYGVVVFLLLLWILL